MKTLIAILVTAAVTAGAALILFYLPERAHLLEARRRSPRPRPG